MGSAQPIGRKPAFFLVIALAFGILALLLIPGLIFLGLLVIFGGANIPVADFGDVLLGLFLVLLIEFIAVMAISCLAQFFNALTMFWRALSAAEGQMLGTYATYGRYLELLPYPTTRWSQFWVNVQDKGWMQWRTLIGILALILIPFASVLFPLRESAGILLALMVVLLGVAGYFFAAQVRRWPLKNRAQRSMPPLSGAALDQRVRASVIEALREDPGAHLAIRQGNEDALAGPVRVVFIATEGLVEPDRIREVVRELAGARAGKKSRVAKKKRAVAKPGRARLGTSEPGQAEPPRSPYAPK